MRWQRQQLRAQLRRRRAGTHVRARSRAEWTRGVQGAVWRWALQRRRLRALPRAKWRQIAHIVVRVIGALNGGRGHGRGYSGGRRFVSIPFVSVGIVSFVSFVSIPFVSVGSRTLCRRPLY